jgi:mitogen-activated protein kinase kinase
MVYNINLYVFFNFNLIYLSDSLFEISNPHASLSTLDFMSLALRELPSKPLPRDYFQIKHFKDFKFMAQGAFGTVFKAKHIVTGTWMALKEIKIMESSMAFIHRIQAELTILQLCSRAIQQTVEYYGAFVLDNSFYICMEWMDLGSLTTWWCRAHAISEEERVGLVDHDMSAMLDLGVHRKTYNFPEWFLTYVAFHVLCGLRGLYEKLLLVHKDIKPSNILLNSNGEIKLCDFGISARALGENNDAQEGCPSYMSPEQLATPAQLDAFGWRRAIDKIDIWSLGISLVELATGKYPFHITAEDSVLAQIFMIVHEPPVLPSVVHFSPLFIDFIAKCLTRDPSGRPSLSLLLVSI